jgi:hypothetical protein
LGLGGQVSLARLRIGAEQARVALVAEAPIIPFTVVAITAFAARAAPAPIALAHAVVLTVARLSIGMFGETLPIQALAALAPIVPFTVVPFIALAAHLAATNRALAPVIPLTVVAITAFAALVALARIALAPVIPFTVVPITAFAARAAPAPTALAHDVVLAFAGLSVGMFGETCSVPAQVALALVGISANCSS